MGQHIGRIACLNLCGSYCGAQRRVALQAFQLLIDKPFAKYTWICCLDPPPKAPVRRRIAVHFIKDARGAYRERTVFHRFNDFCHPGQRRGVRRLAAVPGLIVQSDAHIAISLFIYTDARTKLAGQPKLLTIDKAAAFIEDKFKMQSFFLA